MIKKILKYIFILSLILVCPSYAQQDAQEESNFISYPLAGSLNRTAPYLSMEPGSVQELLNMVRPSPGAPGWKTRAGTTKHNTTTLGAHEVKSLHNYYNKDSNTQYLFAQFNDAIYSATNIPPTAGATFGSSIYSLTASSGTAFSATVGNDVVFAADGSCPFIFAGISYADGVLIDRNVTGEYYQNAWSETRNADTTDYVTFISGTTDYVYVISHRRLDTIYLSFASTYVNDETADATVYTRQAGDWAAVESLNDNGVTTSGKAFAKSGALTWTYSANDESYILPNSNIQGFIYRIGTSAALTAGIRLYQVRVDGDAQKLTPLWDSMWMPATGCFVSGTTTYEDFTYEVTDGSEYSYVLMDGFTTIYVGFVQPVTAIYIQITSDTNNDTVANTPTTYYWNSATPDFTTVGSLDDSSTQGGFSLTRDGIIQWDGDNISENERNFGGNPIQMYWYKIIWSSAFADTDADEDELGITEISGAYKPNTILKKYDGVASYNGRAVFWPGKFYENGLDYTAEGKAWITQGIDAGMTGGIFGPGEVNAFIQLYSYGIVSTKNPPSLFIYEGKIPTKFDELRLTSNIGVVAPHTLLLIEDSVKLFNQNRTVHAVIFMAHDGVYLTDGQTVINISQEVSDYWNLNSTYYIEPSYAHISYAWQEYNERTIHFAVPIHVSGIQTTCNYELIYNYLSGEWYDLHKRYLPMSCGISLIGSDNARYAYAGDYTGFVFKTGTGTSDWGNPIESYLITSDFNPYGKLTLSSVFRRLSVKAKAQLSGEIAISMFPDGKTTALSPSGVTTISMVNSGYGFTSQNGEAINLQGTKAESMAFKFDAGSAAEETMEVYGFTVETQPVREAWE